MATGHPGAARDLSIPGADLRRYKLEFQLALETLTYQCVNLSLEDELYAIQRWVDNITWDENWRAEEWRISEPVSLPQPGQSGLRLQLNPRQQVPAQSQARQLGESQQQVELRPLLWERGMYASRPRQQFLYQTWREHLRLQEINPECTYEMLDLEAIANVKNIWRIRGIWNPRWGDVPGLHWAHEGPFDLRRIRRRV
jgi:hypothetical protein